MALAWVQAVDVEGKSALEVRTSDRAPWFEIFLATRPELLTPGFAGQRTGTDFFSSRAAQGLLRSTNGRALFPLPGALLERFKNGRVYYMVKTFRDEQGNGPALSPVMSARDGPVLSGVDPSEVVMHSSLDLEEEAARLSTGQEFRRGGVSGSVRAASVTTTKRRNPRAAAARSQSAQPGVASALALLTARTQAICAADPLVPGVPSRRDVSRILSHVLSEVPHPSGRGSAASVLNARIHGLSYATGGARELQRDVATALSALEKNDPKSREMFIQAALAAAGPLLTQILPQLLPVLLPMLQQLIGGLAGGQPVAKASSATPRRRDPLYASYGLTRDGRLSHEQFAFLAPLLSFLPQILPALLPMLGQILPGLLGGLAGGKSLSRGLEGTSATQTPTPTAQPAPTVDPAKLAETIKSLLGAAAAGGGAAANGGAAAVAGAPAAGAPAATPPIDPAALMSLLQAAGGAGGINQLAGGPGHELIKSVVDRLPIEKMFDGKAWVPEIKHDEWIQTLPWDKVLSLGSTPSVVSTLFVPGRRELRPLEGVKLELVERKLTRVGNQESWIVMRDQPARLRLRVSTGKEPSERPFIDVRVSVDGTAATGISRSVFRVGTLTPNSARTISIEIPPEVLQRAPSNGAPTCISIRLIEQRAPREFYATELRACVHVMRKHSVVLKPASGARESSELAALPGLQRSIPAAAQENASAISWRVDLVDGAIAGLGQYLPVTRRTDLDEQVLSGGLQVTPLGVADLARRIPRNRLDAEGVGALADALQQDDALRTRFALNVSERLAGPATAPVGVRVEFGIVPAYIVGFTGISADGNPTGRTVREIELPVPFGISLHA